MPSSLTYTSWMGTSRYAPAIHERLRSLYLLFRRKSRVCRCCSASEVSNASRVVALSRRIRKSIDKLWRTTMCVVQDVGAFKDESNMLIGRYIVVLRVDLGVGDEAISVARLGVDVVVRSGGLVGSTFSITPGNCGRGSWCGLILVSPRCPC